MRGLPVFRKSAQTTGADFGRSIRTDASEYNAVKMLKFHAVQIRTKELWITFDCQMENLGDGGFKMGISTIRRSRCRWCTEFLTAPQIRLHWSQ